MKPENRVKFDKFKKKVKVCCSVFGVVVVIGMIVSIVILSILLHHLYNSDEKDNDGCLKDGQSTAVLSIKTSFKDISDFLNDIKLFKRLNIIK